MLSELVFIEIIKALVVPFFSFLLGVISVLLLLRDKRVRKIKIVSKMFSLSSEKFRDLQKNDYGVTKLEIVDEKGKKIKKPYPMKIGIHIFRCMATYTDGSKVFFKPYWLCFEKGGRSSGKDVLGDWKQEKATLSHSENHIRYSELSCWVFPPSKTKSNSHIPSDHTGFGYKN